MNTEEQNIEPNEETKKPKTKPTRVTSREIELLKFLSVMKFSNFEVLWRRFYFNLKNGSLSKSDSYAEERVNALLGLNLIKKSEITIHGMKFYTLSNRGFSFLEKILGPKAVPNPTDSIDLKNFHHDFEVLLLRDLIERNSKSIRWISEREILRGDLPFSYKKRFGFENTFAPDGLLEHQTIETENKLDQHQETHLPTFEDESMGLTAIELELSPRSNSRYQEKVLRYVNLIRESSQDKSGIKKVIYYCISDQALNAINRETSYYPGNFVVVKHQSLIKQRMFYV